MFISLISSISYDALSTKEYNPLACVQWYHQKEPYFRLFRFYFLLPQKNCFYTSEEQYVWLAFDIGDWSWMGDLVRVIANIFVFLDLIPCPENDIPCHTKIFSALLCFPDSKAPPIHQIIDFALLLFGHFHVPLSFSPPFLHK